MHIKIEDDAEILQTTNRRNSSVYTVLNVVQDEIIDCDELQQIRNAIRPRIIEDVIVA